VQALRCEDDSSRAARQLVRDLVGLAYLLLEHLPHDTRGRKFSEVLVQDVLEESSKAER
jgi:hypothetical protein